MAQSLRLVIGNKKLSSWSLRAWIAMAHGGLAFGEERILLDRPETGSEIRRFSGAGRVPVLLDGELTVHDSLAILEYLNETHLPDGLLPRERKRRARVRSVSAEMHAGFSRLRERLPMNLSRPPGPITVAGQAIDRATRDEIDRVLTLWEQALAESGGPFLFGEWSMADCMYLPVATRFRTYAVALDGHPLAGAWLERVLSLPAFRRWESEARAEPQDKPEHER